MTSPSPPLSSSKFPNYTASRVDGMPEGPPALNLDVALFLMWLFSKGGDG